MMRSKVTFALTDENRFTHLEYLSLNHCSFNSNFLNSIPWGRLKRFSFHQTDLGTTSQLYAELWNKLKLLKVCDTLNLHISNRYFLLP